MPKGSIRNPGTLKTATKRGNEAVARVAAADKARSQRQAKAANDWNEYRAAMSPVSAGHATKALRKSMQDVRSVASTGGALARIKENPGSALKRRAATKKK